jgi:hypothetical protein
MRQLIIFLGFGLATGACLADPDASSAPAAAGTSAPLHIPAHVQRPPAVPPPPSAQPAAADRSPALFTAEEKWALAGYNNDEVIYTIIITSHDSRIIRCNTELQGFYYENGKKVGISDRQSSTVFPTQNAQAGNWIGMDQKSGSTYSVKCHPL